jgi:hypothetical protein
LNSTILVLSLLLVPQAGVQLPSAAASAIHFSHFSTQFGGATDEKFIEERIDPITLTLDEELFFRDLLRDSRPVNHRIEDSIIRMVVRFDQSEGLVADAHGRWSLTSSRMRNSAVFELSAPAMILLNEMLGAKGPSLVDRDSGTQMKVPPKESQPRRYRAIGTFSEVDSVGKIISLGSRRAWRDEPLSQATDPRSDGDAIRRLIRIARPTIQSIDETKVWFTARTARGELLHGDANGRMRISRGAGQKHTFDLSSADYLDLDALLTQIRVKASK